MEQSRNQVSTTSAVFRIILALTLVMLLIPNAAFASDPEVDTADATSAVDTVADTSATETSAEEITQIEPASEADESVEAVADATPINQAPTAGAVSENPDRSAADITEDTGIVALATGEEDGMYCITVKYVDENGVEIIAPQKKIAAAGESYSITSPTIGGYEVADPNQLTLTGTAGGSDHFPVLSVAYKSSLVPYTVVYMKQAGNAVYYQAESEQRNALSGELVTMAPKNIPGFHCITTGDDLKLRVSPDGQSVIKLYYDVDQMAYTLSFYTQGSYVPNQVGIEGTAITTPAAPTRPGYTFAGWDTNGDGAVDALPATMPAHDVFADAVWTPAQASYVVNYWYEKLQTPGEYTMFKTVVETGTTDTVAPNAPLEDTSKGSDLEFYEYSHEDTITIAADSSSVKNVYYNTVMVTVIFNVLVPDGSNVKYKEDQAKFGTSYPLPPQDEVNALYAANGGDPTWNFTGWWTGGHMSPTLILDNDVDFDTRTVTYQGQYSSTAQRFDYVVFFETLTDDEYGNEEHGTAFMGSSSVSLFVYDDVPGFHMFTKRLSNTLYNGQNYNELTWGDWEDTVFDENTGRDYTDLTQSDGHNYVEFKSERLSYDVTYYSQGVEQGKITHKYQEPFQTSECVPTPPQPDLAFVGWYVDDQFTGDPVATEEMPVGGINLYAKWEKAPVTVTFDTQGGSAVNAQTVPFDGTSAKPEDPTKTGATFMGWYVFDADGVPARFEFDRPLEADITVYAMWDPPTPSVTYTVEHKNLNTGALLKSEQFMGSAEQTYTTAALDATDPARADLPYVDAGYKSITLSEDAAQNVVTYYYDTDNIYTYTVHYISATTGKAVAPDVVFYSNEGMVDVYAPDVYGYFHVDDAGYVTLDTPEYTFVYDRDYSVYLEGSDDNIGGDGSSSASSSADAATAGANGATKASANSSALPKTGDAGMLVLIPLASLFAAAGMFLIARRRRIDA